jgi:hypothetical protein
VARLEGAVRRAAVEAVSAALESEAVVHALARAVEARVADAVAARVAAAQEASVAATLRGMQAVQSEVLRQGRAVRDVVRDWGVRLQGAAATRPE